jgi:hypothetical protein
MLENRKPHRSFMQHVLDILVVASNAESHAVIGPGSTDRGC